MRGVQTKKSNGYTSTPRRSQAAAGLKLGRNILPSATSRAALKLLQQHHQQQQQRRAKQSISSNSNGSESPAPLASIEPTLFSNGINGINGVQVVNGYKSHSRHLPSNGPTSPVSHAVNNHNTPNHPHHHSNQRSANLINIHTHQRNAKHSQVSSIKREGLTTKHHDREKLNGSKPFPGSPPKGGQNVRHEKSKDKTDHGDRETYKPSPAKGEGLDHRTEEEGLNLREKRFRFIKITLIVCNALGLLLGVVGLVVAGFVDPRPLYQVGTLGGQLSLASVYLMLASLTGLYGARRESSTLLCLYGSMILVALFCRSVTYFIVSFISTGTLIALSMTTGIFEVLLVLCAFALASEIRIKKMIKRKESDDVKV